MTRDELGHQARHPYKHDLVCENEFLNFNSLWPSDAIWDQVTWSTLVQVMAWCLSAPSHYLNQCWLITGRSCSTWGQFHRKCSRWLSCIMDISSKITNSGLQPHLPKNILTSKFPCYNIHRFVQHYSCINCACVTHTLRCIILPPVYTCIGTTFGKYPSPYPKSRNYHWVMNLWTVFKKWNYSNIHISLLFDGIEKFAKFKNTSKW